MRDGAREREDKCATEVNGHGSIKASEGPLCQVGRFQLFPATVTLIIIAHTVVIVAVLRVPATCDASAAPDVRLRSSTWSRWPTTMWALGRYLDNPSSYDRPVVCGSRPFSMAGSPADLTSEWRTTGFSVHAWHSGSLGCQWGEFENGKGQCVQPWA